MEKSKLNPMAGHEIRALRKKLGKSQAEFWSPIGVEQSSGSQYERGATPPNAVHILLNLVYGTKAKAAELFKSLRSWK